MLLDTSRLDGNFSPADSGRCDKILDALRPEDQVAVIDFNGKGAKLQLPFTTDHNRVAYAIGIICLPVKARRRCMTP
jgi:hypothetical protein